MKHDEFQVKGHRFGNEVRALLRVNLRGAFSVCIKRMMGGRVIEANTDFVDNLSATCQRMNDK